MDVKLIRETQLEVFREMLKHEKSFIEKYFLKTCESEVEAYKKLAHFYETMLNTYIEQKIREDRKDLGLDGLS